MKLTSVYFSATYTTRKVVEYISGKLSNEMATYDITNDTSDDEVLLSENDLLVVGIPVYAGRVPSMAVNRIRRFKGKRTPAVALAIYGNRDYDDALLELSDILSDNGFKVISAAAFIAQHSIFPKVGAGRPDASDYKLMDEFADETLHILRQEDKNLLPIHIRGNRPYKIPGSIPIYPSATKTCKECGKCVSLCPVGAIPASNPRMVDEEKCIKCGRCIVVCPSHSRGFKGFKYMLASLKFNQAFKARKEPDFFLARY